MPLAIAAVVLTTALPVELRPALLWDGVFDGLDLLQNLILYAPLGVALSRQRSWIIAAAAFTFSAAAETIQIWSFERFSSPYDVIANVLGALVGAWAWRRYGAGRDAKQIVFSRSSVLGCLVIALLIFAVWLIPIRSAELTNWNPDFRILLGNEVTADRPWKGTIASMTILQGAFTPAELIALGNAHAGAGDQLDALTLYRSSGRIRLNGEPAVVLPQSLSRDLAARIQTEGAFTLIVQLATDEVAQRGPARIVSFSHDTLQRNFDLGQEEGRLTLRVRTPVSGLNGEDFRAETPAILQRGQLVTVVASYDGAVSRIHVDESLYGRSNLAAAGCVVPALCDAAVPLAWSVVGAIAGMFILALMPWPKHRWKALVAALAAGGVPMVVQLGQWAPSLVLTPSWMKYMSLVGASVVAIAAYSGAKPTSEPGSSTTSNEYGPSQERTAARGTAVRGADVRREAHEDGSAADGDANATPPTPPRS